MLHKIHGGFLLALEGIDGTGKSTLAPALAEHARILGYECVLSREPTDGPWGRALRESARHGRLSLQDELEHFLRDREEHVSNVIRPALEDGQVVVLDRYYLSTAAYQGVRGADPEAIIAENEIFAPRPDLVLLLDVDPAISLGRVRGRGDAPDEFERGQALEQVRQAFLALQVPGIVRVDAGRTPAEVRREAEALFAAALAHKRA